MTSRAKTKGSGYERQVADFLTNLYGEKFLRAPGSGAYVGGKNSARKEFLHEGQVRVFKSDIVPGQSFPKMNIECKAYREFPFHQLFTGKVKLLDSWIEQATTAEDEGDLTMLCMKFDRKGQYVAVKNSTPGITTINSLVYTSEQYGSWVFMEHTQFWQLNAETVKQLCA
jgi:Holliday junction resolvase